MSTRTCQSTIIQVTWCAVTSFQRPCRAVQVPFAAQIGPNRYSNTTPTEWRLDKPPNVNSTGHLMFETVNSLLRHWLNTRMRNGHSIVPGMVPSGTLLYHWDMEHIVRDNRCPGSYLLR
ncbi:hypothetical protein SCLCIDRAFT_747305 [Scleroderma citrinum Foug A]|uniref:Uncharacterized protein n=1 Tax=Scleroderma citrinum Foug A TaxID=1036808 RepID=A0A0C3AF21_9AGAM|nr:hypothetical protein SCLCIDRAFT_747305 [Scleroderma citrinum Foug A]